MEKIGIQRAKAAIADADHVLLLVDSTESPVDNVSNYPDLNGLSLTLVANKIDLLSNSDELSSLPAETICISAKTRKGLDQLKEEIKKVAGYTLENESVFTARRRHLQALEDAAQAVAQGLEQLTVYNAGELLAQELYTAQQYLNEITGEFSSDDLLGEIFSGFCIGK